MSKRTAEANKAIRLAWENERTLVKEGKGTRDWTEEQQKDILEKGKAYDDNGRAFEGQHMKSAEKYTEYQSDPGNIQFLTREEHLEAHHGNWQNPTNWYYNPVTKEIIDFGEGKYKPCKVIELSEPITIAVNKANPETNNTISNKTRQQETAHNKVPDKPQAPSSLKAKGTKTVKSPAIKKQAPKEKTIDFKHFFSEIRNSFNKFKKEHPIITGFFEAAVPVIISTNVVYNGKSSNNNPQSDDNDLNFDYDENNTTDNDFDNEPVDDTLEKSKRSSPRENDVPESRQRYHTKNGVEWRDKAPYHRGGKKDEDDDQE